jgi:hypothetical protein
MDSLWTRYGLTMDFDKRIQEVYTNHLQTMSGDDRHKKGMQQALHPLLVCYRTVLTKKKQLSLYLQNPASPR